ncbi:MAG: molybdenum cofactor guanylyltransferase [Dehalococcoidales bacterium]|nr:molybdenum cofactor guanylyltransferase [Dehalococcoidales bacterium]
MEVNCIILAGGKSERLGRDKIVEKIGTTSLLDKVISLVKPLSGKIIIVTANERNFSQYTGRPDITVITDIIPGQGSLGGIYTGLVTSDSFHNLVLAADMPFLNEPLLRYMMEVSDGYDFILPRIDTLYEPLHAVYSRNCIAPIETIFSQNKKVIIELFNYVKIRFVDKEEVDRFDPQHLSFFNINTLEDLERAREIAGGSDL